MKKIFTLFVLSLMTVAASAQLSSDALRFSRINTSGDARYSAMGGAFSALGGNLTSIGVNPAGLGVYRRTEFGITPLVNVSVNSDGLQSVKKVHSDLGQLGFVLSFYNEEKDLRGLGFSFTYNQTNNFYRRMTQRVDGSPTSFSQSLANEANYYGSLTDIQKIADAAGVILYVEDPDGNYFEPTLIGSNQMSHFIERGYQGEYSFSFGANVLDKFYFGLALGLGDVSYEFNYRYTENPDQENFYKLDHFNYTERVFISGTGVNFKAGVIYRPFPELRLGLAMHTPSLYSMYYQFGNSFESKFLEAPFINESETEFSDENFYDYNYEMTTPWRFILSAATVLGGRTILSAEYEYADYGTSTFYDFDYDYYSDNQAIASLYRAPINFRLGGEFRLDQTISLRAGYHYESSPYKNEGIGFSTQISGGNALTELSCGLGLNFGWGYIDLAYLYNTSSDKTISYEYLDPEDHTYDVQAQPISNIYKNHNFKFSTGIKF